jgi:outer membrane lipoprotein-sorting protein
MRLLFALLLLLSTDLSAKPAALGAKDVDTVLAKYRKAQAIQAKVRKTVVQETMGMETTSTGDFYFSKGKLRLDFTEPEKTSLVYDGKFVWLESRLDDQNIQVTKMRTNELKRSKSVLTALFEKKDILRNFKLVKSASTEGKKSYFFEPKKKKADDEIQLLQIVIKNKELERISYKDQLENTVSFDFTELKKGKVPAAKFSYKVPKNAQVTEI